MERKNKFTTFLKKYGTFCVAGILVFAMAFTILITGLTAPNNAKVDEEPSVETNTGVLTFTMPMENATLIKDFSSNELFLNTTLGRWEFHDGIDLSSSDLKVYSVADGVVSNVSEDALNGVSVTITHSNQLKSVYNSLNSNVLVKEGDTVEKGTQIGEADSTASSEEKDGKHLHFEMIKDNSNIDPANYLELQNK